MKVQGIYIPLVTPFAGGSVDYASLKSLVDHYIGAGVSGLIPAGTTGEGPVLEEAEFEELLDRTVEFAGGRVPVYCGVGGAGTKAVIHKLAVAARYRPAGALVASPYYNRPDQRGIYEHFRSIASSTDLDIILYNVPYRTGRNVENDTVRRLAELSNIVGIKDACGDIRQTMDLLLDRPEKLSVLCGEDILFHLTLALGGDGGILASAHVRTDRFIELYGLMKGNDLAGGLEVWRELNPIIPLLFEEPNPAPLKYLLAREGLIASGELRPPLCGISETLKMKLAAVKVR